MANTEINEPQEDQLENVENQLGRTEQYIENNKEKLFTILAVIVLLIVAVMAYFKYFKAPKEERAAAEMFMAEQNLEKDSFKLALNGDANYPGFLKIIDNYGSTKAGNNAHYYAAVCYLHIGEFDKAIEMLKGFSSSDPTIEPLSIGLMGDAYSEKGNNDEAVSYYKKAADKAAKNDFIAPYILQKLANTYEIQQKYQDALNIYEKIKTEYPLSREGALAEKYIQAMKIKLGK
ncbi:MAG: tetratricopeptide repeat protein [Bacteroidales bacterium]|jgi:tetratricopeptide (TPR) repeat protein|nr:tetratricopeptide repeat protein [Bacteroidales bacterium]